MLGGGAIVIWDRSLFTVRERGVQHFAHPPRQGSTFRPHPPPLLFVVEEWKSGSPFPVVNDLSYKLNQSRLPGMDMEPISGWKDL